MVDIICKGLDWQKAPPGGWGLNEWIFKRPFDVIFDMHNIPEDIEKGIRHKYKVDRMYDKAEKYGTVIYSLEAWENSPCIKYPLEEIKGQFGIDYFVSSVDYMLALAIFQKKKRINLWGAHFRLGDEYDYQRPSATFWLGVAHGMGIEIRVKTPSKLFFMGEIYGYNTKPKLINNFMAVHPSACSE